jgi:hypothetical protein
MTAKFTPGPWDIIEDSDGHRIRKGRYILGRTYENADDAANASLIAAAPELYAALVAVLEWAAPIAGDNQNDVAAQKEIGAIDLANAALAKARGEA